MTKAMLEEYLKTIFVQTFPGRSIPPYYIDYSDKKSYKNSNYDEKQRLITVYNKEKPAAILLCSILHELAHHYHFNVNRTMDHDYIFYETLKKLYENAIELGFLTTNQCRYLSDSTDIIKIEMLIGKINASYRPEIDFDRHNKIVELTGKTYQYKDDLKLVEYKWDETASLWYCKVKDSELEVEIENIEKRFPDLSIYVRRCTDLLADATLTVSICGKTYPYKDSLKERGYKYDKEKSIWVNEFKGTEFDEVIDFLKTLRGAKVKIS